MNLYIVDYWVPFPSSEYGDIQIWAAEHEGRLKDLIEAQCDEYYKKGIPNYKNLISKWVGSAKVFYLAEDVEEGYIDGMET